MDWKFANAAAPVTVLSPVSRWRCPGDVLALSLSLCCRRVWRCAGDVLAGIILRPISPYAGWTGICHAAVLSLCCRRVLVGDVLVIVLAAVAVTVLSPGVAMCW